MCLHDLISRRGALRLLPAWSTLAAYRGAGPWQRVSVKVLLIKRPDLADQLASLVSLRQQPRGASAECLPRAPAP